MRTEDMYYNEQKRSEVRRRPEGLEENSLGISRQRLYTVCLIRN